jgi:putative NIF3 family GTP cyclohydrolase 1 type 2
MSNLNTPFNINRRKFVQSAGLLLALPAISRAGNFIKLTDTYTVKQVMDLFISAVPGGAMAKTVDTLKAGSPDMVVTGIVTTMFATIDVIKKTIALGANFIIAHEPTFYNHTDETAWLANDEVYKYKANLLKQHNIAVWRNHDYIHTIVPDGVMVGVLAQMGWKEYADKSIYNIITLPAARSVSTIVGEMKDKLHIEKVRFVGDAAQQCKRVLFMEGAAGGHAQIEAIGKVKPDLVVCGEISEWETAEYIRDARATGEKISLAVIGHIASEEPGSEYMLNWLKANLPSIKATHVLSGNSLSFL